MTKGFELADTRTDLTKFIARCKAEGCPWRIHASRIHDRKTIQVSRCALVYFFVCFTGLCFVYVDQNTRCRA
jgi:hypothetical protein